MKTVADTSIQARQRAIANGGMSSKILWNIAGITLPLVIAAFSVPRLLALIGTERFGLLALAWGLIGYASMLDLGIGRATTQHISSLRGAGHTDEVPNVLATAVRLTTITGIIGMLLIMLAAITGVYRFIDTKSIPAGEIEYSIMLLALALPMQAMSATFRGVNEAYLNFQSISTLRVLLGAANFGAPYAVALYTQQLHWLIATLVLSRGLALVFYRKFATDCLRAAGYQLVGRYTGQYARQLMRFGGWFTVSSVVSPLLVQTDRFFIGVLLSASAITLYVIPYEVTVQALVVTGAVTTVAFPLISNLIRSAPERANTIFRQWQLRLGGVMLVLMATLACIMPDLLRVWLQRPIAEESVRVGQILCAGVFLNSVGAMYFSLLHAHGKTRETACLHLFELPLYIGTLYLLIGKYGVIGAACAWVLRVGFDTSALIVMTRLVLRRPERDHSLN